MKDLARRSTCQNNLKQIALAMQQHHQAQESLPAGGWGGAWVGDPDRGYGIKQPGGWIYNILAYTEQTALRSQGAGQSAAQKMATLGTVISTPLPMMNCPTRRPAMPRAYVSYANAYNATTPTVGLVRGDYAINGGDSSDMDNGGEGGPPSLAAGDTSYSWPSTAAFDGIAYVQSVIRLAHITDGTVNTYMVGEKYLDPDHYDNGVDQSDDWSMYTGFQGDIGRSGNLGYAPLQDTPGVGTVFNFGSAHSGGFNMAFCDGSVHVISYSIDAETHRRLSNRKDGLPVDGSKF